MTVKERWRDPEVGVPFIQLMGGPLSNEVALDWTNLGPLHTIFAFLNEEAISKAMPTM